MTPMNPDTNRPVREPVISDPIDRSAAERGIQLPDPPVEMPVAPETCGECGAEIAERYDFGEGPQCSVCGTAWRAEATFDVWIDGERTGGIVRAASLADAVRVVRETANGGRGISSPGFSGLGRFDVSPTGGSWTDRALCSCEVEDPGDAENGPRLEIVESSETCDLHGRVADPGGWTSDGELYAATAARTGR